MSEFVRQCPACGEREDVFYTRRRARPDEAEHPYILDEYYCLKCNLTEWMFIGGEAHSAFRIRWGAPLPPPMTDAELDSLRAETAALLEQQDREWAWPVEAKEMAPRDERAKMLARHVRENGYTVWPTENPTPCHVVGFPEDPDLFAAVLADPDDDAPRTAYARWIWTLDDSRAKRAAIFIDDQLRLAQALRADPRSEFRSQLDQDAFSWPDQREDWWRMPDSATTGLADAMMQRLAILVELGLVAEPLYYRGFVEHVAMRAYRFLELADELFEAAPIRHLTLTFCKGHDHQDEGLWKALLQSPHLARIRSLQFVTRTTARELARFNRFTDRDLELLAESPHVGGLAYLRFEDAEDLTIRGFEALAASTNLRSLSYVRHDRYRYAHQVQSSWGGLGAYERTLLRNQLGSWTEQIEARHGHQVWLHPETYYGTATPDLEAVVEHPVARLRGQGSSG